MREAGLVARMGERRGVNRGLDGKSQGKRPLGEPRRRWERNIKMDHKYMFLFNYQPHTQQATFQRLSGLSQILIPNYDKFRIPHAFRTSNQTYKADFQHSFNILHRLHV